MRKEPLHQAKQYIRQKRQHRVWSRIVAGLACVVVFATTYMLILPAITMEQPAYCGIEAHTHDESCFEKQLVCGLEDSIPHVHSESCYQEERVLICDQNENPGHVHDESCIQRELVPICTEDHEHSDACYQTVETYICGLTEGEGAHTHGSECFKTELVLICGEEENAEGHVHTDACYEDVLICPKEEHEHTLECFSNPEADVENQAAWEQTLSDIELTGIWADDVLAVAKSQLGYAESTRNYTVTEDGQQKGYSRYGAWYGDPYGDWCAMFVSFCLHYAGVEGYPLDANCQNWIETLSRDPYQSYFDAGSYDPQPGDLIFFNTDDKEGADHIGIVTENIESTDTAQIRTIEGNSSNCVQYVTYRLDDPTILGYGKLPKNPRIIEGGSLGEDSITESNYDVSADEGHIEDDPVELPTSEIVDDTSFSVFSLHAAVTGNETMSIHVEKQWVGDASYLRPDSITVKLLCNGEETGDVLSLSADNDWSGAFTGNFSKYDESGAEIKYSVSEESVSDYELVSDDYIDTASSIDLNALELWVPVSELEDGENYLVVTGLSGNQSLYRAESSVTDGVLSAAVTVNEGSVCDQDGNEYENYILLNTEAETGQSLYLSWKALAVDGGVNLQSNVYTAWTGKTKYLLSQGDKWKVTDDGTQESSIFTSDENGGFYAGESSSVYLFKKVSLDISSLPASSYTRNYTLVNRYEPDTPSEPDPESPPQATTTSVNVTKKWDDGADHSDDSVTVWLIRDGERTEQSVILNAENNWTCCFEQLPIYKADGTKYVYDAQEENNPAFRAEYQYETTYRSGDALWLPASSFEDGVTFLIVTSAGTGDVIGMEASNKGFAWTSGAGAGTIYVSSSNSYPRYITDEEALQHTAMQWIAEDLGIKKANQVGTRHVYALKNAQYGLYAKNNGQGDLSNGCNGDATWWYYGYTKIDEAGKEANRYPKKTPENNWGYILGSMNDYFLLDNNHTGDGGSQAAQTFYLYRRYEIQEPQLNVTITNYAIEKTSLSVRKDWIDDASLGRPESITIRLLANGEDTGITLVLSKETYWCGSFNDLPIGDTSGKPIEYTVSEDPVEGYISSYYYGTEDGMNRVVITNSTQPVLPDTGGSGTFLFTFCGLGAVAGTLMYRYSARRRRERRIRS